VPIRAILQNDYSAFGPEDVARLTAAFEAALSKLGLVNRNDPATLTVAEVIIALAKKDERNPSRLSDRAVELLSK